jgi:hypothetical protein
MASDEAPPDAEPPNEEPAAGDSKSDGSDDRPAGTDGDNGNGAGNPELEGTADELPRLETVIAMCGEGRRPRPAGFVETAGVGTLAEARIAALSRRGPMIRAARLNTLRVARSYPSRYASSRSRPTRYH